MYERMLDKQQAPAIMDLAAYCGENADRFARLNTWLSQNYGTIQQISFPYGNHYGWGIAHRIRQKLICRVFAEKQAFSVMIHLSDAQFQSLYGKVRGYTQKYIDEKYPCGNGGWIQYRVICQEHLEDIQKLLSSKFTRQIPVI